MSIGRLLTPMALLKTQVVVAVVCALHFAPMALAEAKKDGWWIRVRPDKQESPTITIFIGSNNHTIEAWKTWSSGEPPEFDVPDKFRNINPLYIKAQSSGGDGDGECSF
jgi:hypothetical protein